VVIEAGSLDAGSKWGDTLCMHFDPRAGIMKTGGADGRRRRGRLGQEAVISDIGTVVDLSCAGMRVKNAKIPKGEEFPIRIMGLGTDLTVRGRLAWIRKRGLFSKEAGIEFIDVTEEIARQITSLGMNNRCRRTI
jgi:hypothetical protein